MAVLIRKSSLLIVSGLILVALVGLRWLAPGGDSKLAQADRSEVTSAEPSPRIDELRAQLDTDVWQQEVLAQRYESFFVRLWDRLRVSSDPLSELAKISLTSIAIPTPASTTRIEHDIELVDMNAGPVLKGPKWMDFVLDFRAAGYQLVQSEWHHARFTQTPGGAQSTVSVSLHVTNASRQERAVIQGDLVVDWSADDDNPVPRQVDATGLHVRRRIGSPPFRLAATLPATQMRATDFVAAYDFDGDGLSEIVFGNQLFRNKGDGGFFAERLCRHRDAPLQSAVLADFNGDGRVDLFCADPHEVPRLFLADANGRFSGEPHTFTELGPIQDFSTAMTAGDVNGDGHLDVWLTQYKRPYVQGQMPTPYYDANDGYPAYLLIGDGRGQFVDRTVAAGLSAKRNRRTYSSSLVDIDNDGDLDLVVVSDFAGLDLHVNDGAGNFHELTGELVDEPHTFGMSHAIADFDGDAQLDLFVTGMGSTTARRLDAMQAGPAGRGRETMMRTVMGYGNRLYLAREGRFEEARFGPQVARTGWSWGVVEFDFDNDGDRDLYVGNGHISGPSVRDYCSVFWRHDIYAGTSQPDPALEQLFTNTHQQFQQDGSWNGYEHNCLLLNLGGTGFQETAFLFGLAHEFDTRNIIADDIDGNGLVDLLIVQRPRGRPSSLQIWKNYSADAGHWIGVVVTDQPGMLTPGTKVVVRSDAGRQVAHVINGDSFNCQHSATLHFGLGTGKQVSSIEIIRPGGAVEAWKNPAVGKYHRSPTVPRQ